MVSNRKRPQVTFNMNSTIEADLYNKVHALNPESISDAIKYVLFAYFYPPGGGQISQQSMLVENLYQEEEILDDVSGLPNL